MTKPTMQDVADYVGVSKSTVSQYLNQHYNFMSPATRKKIAAAIKTLDYQPNQVAKSLKQKRTKIIAIVCSSLSSRFLIQLISAVEGFCQQQGYTVVIARTHDDPATEKRLITSFINRQIDGIIVFPTKQNTAYYQELAQRDFPIVFVDRYLPDVPIDSVLLDNPLAAQLAVEELINRGHQRIGIVTLPLGDQITTRQERLQGYLDTLAAHQLPVVKTNIISCERSEVAARLTRLFAVKKPPTALFLTNDMLLEDTLNWVRTTSLHVGQELSLVCLDDVSFARFYEPPITTVAQPVTDIGLTAATLLLAKIQAPASAATAIIRKQPQLHVRESIRDLNATT